MMQPLHEGREVQWLKTMRQGGDVEFDGEKQEEDDEVMVMGCRLFACCWRRDCWFFLGSF